MRFAHFHLRPITSDDAEAFFQLIDRNRPRLEDLFAGTVAVTRTLEATHTHVTAMLAYAREQHGKPARGGEERLHARKHDP